MSFTPGPGTVRLTPSSPTGNPYVQWDTTWNNAGTTFTGIKFDVTDTASAAGSLLMDLRVGGSSRFSVTKAGVATLSSTLSAVAFQSNSLAGSTSFIFGDYGGVGIRFGEACQIRWSSGAPTNTPDLVILRDAANILAQRNGTNAQTFRVYKTFTDAANYVRGELTASSFFQSASGSGLTNEGSFEIGNLTGTTNLYFRVNAGTRVWYFEGTTGHFLANADNTYDIGAAAATRPRNLFLGSYAQLSEMTAPAAPAANSVRIYAVDNGSGKTQLMALFATGAAQQIAIEP